MSQQAKIADKMAIIRSVHHTSDNHEQGRQLIQIGFMNDGSPENRMPSIGSIVTRPRGAKRPLGRPTARKACSRWCITISVSIRPRHSTITAVAARTAIKVSVATACRQRTYAMMNDLIRRYAKARATGLEPATSGSTVRCSNQLSYAP